MIKRIFKTQGGQEHKVNNAYILQVGSRGIERLEVLAAAAGPTTREFLDRLDIRPGMQCLDVGCGIGSVTVEIARAVTKSGRVKGIDLDSSCLDHARLQVGSLPIVYQKMDARELSASAAYDLIYSRFLLSHLTQPDEVLHRMTSALRVGGVLAIEDVDFDGHFSHPPCPAFDRFVHLYQALAQLRGADANLGRRLPELMRAAGLEQVEFSVVLPTFETGPGKQMAFLTLEQIAEGLLESGLITASELDSMIRELATFTDAPHTLMSMPRIFQVRARRPAGR